MPLTVPFDPNPIDGTLVVIEKYNKRQKEVLADFVDDEAFDAFPVSRFSRTDSTPSMLLFQNYDQKPVKEGTIYRISSSAIDQLITQERIRLENNSFAIGFTVNASGFDPQLFNRYKVLEPGYWTLPDTLGTRREANDEVLDDLADSFALTTNFDKIIIRDVGQGNWNELYRGNHLELLYDIGAPYPANKGVVSKIAQSRAIPIEVCRPGLIISHWDIDHYHALLSLSDSVLGSFRFVLFRGNTVGRTSSRIARRLRQSNTNTIIINPIPKPPGIRHSINNLKCFSRKIDSTQKHSWRLFNTYEDNDKNRTSFSLLCYTPKASVFLSGDLHYEQVNTITSLVPIMPKHHCVLPHHGGNAGKPIYSLDPRTRRANAIVSVGKNTYGHPIQSNLDFFAQSSFTVQQTRFKGDICVPLS